MERRHVTPMTGKKNMSNPFDSGYYSSEELKNAGFNSVGQDVLIAKNCTIVGLENISIGSHVRIDSYTSILAGKAGVVIGNYVHIASSCYLGGRAGIIFEDFSGLSQGVRIYSQTDDYNSGMYTNPTVPKEYTKIKSGPVKLEKHVIVGSGTVILPGCTLSKGTSVGALSLIRKTTEEWKVYFGNPARIIGSRKTIDEDGSIEMKLLAKNKEEAWNTGA